MRHPSTGNATAREFDYNETSLIVAFARCSCSRRRTGLRRDAVPPALGSLHLQFFSFCRGQRLPTTPLYSLRTPSSPLLLRPLQLLLLLLLLTSLLLIVDIAIAVVDLAKLFASVLFSSWFSLLSASSSCTCLYICCVGAGCINGLLLAVLWSVQPR